MQFSVALAATFSLVGFAVATPPACIINAIGVQGSDATDMDNLCVDSQEAVLEEVASGCTEDFVEAAYEHYSSMCLEQASVTVAALSTATSGSSSSSTGTSGSDSTVTGASESESSDGSDDSEGAGVRVEGGMGLMVTVMGAMGVVGMLI